MVLLADPIMQHMNLQLKYYCPAVKGFNRKRNVPICVILTGLAASQTKVRALCCVKFMLKQLLAAYGQISA